MSDQRQTVYERVLSTVYHQTSPQQMPGCTAGELRTILIDHANRDEDQFNSALRAAVENGDLVRWTGPDGRRRYTRADDEDALRRAVAYLAEGCDVMNEDRKRTLGKLNTAIAEVSEDE